MGKGKAAAQCAHAAVDLYKKASKLTPKLVRQWETFGQAKVALKGPEGGIEALELLQKQAKEEGLATVIILGTIHIFRKHLYSTKLNMTMYLIFQQKTGFSCQNKRIDFSTLHFDKNFTLDFDIFGK